MGKLTKKYRLFWNTTTKEIANNYKNDYSKSVTSYLDNGKNTCFESDTYQDILDIIKDQGLVERRR